MSGRGGPDGALDELAEIRKSRARFLFQVGRQDEVVPRAQLVALIRAAPRTKEVRWYDAGHLLDRQAFHDQLRWLARQLGLGGPVVRGGQPGPQAHDFGFSLRRATIPE